MHIILGFFAILGGAAFWWWRMKSINEAANDVTDAAGRAIGKYKRYKFRKKVEDSPVEAVDDPLAAAVVMMIALVQERGPLLEPTETAIRRELTKVMGVKEPTEVMVFAKWVASHVVDANAVSLRYGKLWIGALNRSEREDFLGSVERVVAADGPVTDGQRSALVKLRERLALLN
jgi:hypothetical protein